MIMGNVVIVRVAKIEIKIIVTKSCCPKESKGPTLWFFSVIVISAMFTF